MPPRQGGGHGGRPGPPLAVPSGPHAHAGVGAGPGRGVPAARTRCVVRRFRGEAGERTARKHPWGPPLALDAPVQANVAWIALAVGLHFLPLARHWRTRSLLAVAVYMSVLGSAGLAMALTGHPDWVPLVSGVVTGLGMLTGLLVGLLVPLVTARGSGSATADTAPTPSP
ncbi:hypothetical protein [Nocardiopsis dassonvillei]|uniref:hypothetical protein n=1 Tax=Nocardiopsis dassonvillei TaxID=2014 RepID=UPI003628C55D